MNKKILSILTGFLIVAMFGIVFAATQQTTTATATVNEFLSVTLTNVPVTFPAMDPGTTKNASVGNGFPLTSTIGNETNVNANVTTKANQTSFGSPSGSFAVGNMSWSGSSSGSYTAYSNSTATVCSGKTAGQACDIFHRLSIPAAQLADTYNIGITISALKA